MKLLVCLNGNASEWQECFEPRSDHPRLPLPYAFGLACANAGFALVGLELSSSKSKREDVKAFNAIYPASRIVQALADADLAVFWGGAGVRQCLREALRPRDKRRIGLLAYAWREKGGFSAARRVNLFITRIASRFARCAIAMTAEQAADVRQGLPAHVPVVQLRVGVDTRYYARQAHFDDVPAEHRPAVERLLQAPYVILPGDELRLNNDALDVVEATGLKLVRVSQYSAKSRTNLLKTEIARRGMEEQVEVFEKISYGFLRFLLQRAVGYAGFVDATWQPAGWTAVCESLASGLPVVLYDGYVARELVALGLPRELCRVVRLGDRATFGQALVTLTGRPRSDAVAASARSFALQHLDLEMTGPVFGASLRRVLESAP